MEEPGLTSLEGQVGRAGFMVSMARWRGMECFGPYRDRLRRPAAVSQDTQMPVDGARLKTL